MGTLAFDTALELVEVVVERTALREVTPGTWTVVEEEVDVAVVVLAVPAAE